MVYDGRKLMGESMKNKKKIIIVSCVIGLVLVMILLATNVGMKLKYDTKARSTAELVKKNKADEFAKFGVKIGKLKYMYTIHDPSANTYDVVYYAKWTDEKPCWFFVHVYLNGSTKSIENSEDYTSFYGEEEKAIKNTIKYTSISEYNDTIWNRADRMKSQSAINLIFILALLAIVTINLFLNKDIIRSLYDTLVKNKSNKLRFNDVTKSKDTSNISKLEELSIMRDKGLISDQEFQAKKNQILDNI
jgi:hypothetical protein